jgi:hypothetical protein
MNARARRAAALRAVDIYWRISRLNRRIDRALDRACDLAVDAIGRTILPAFPGCLIWFVRYFEMRRDQSARRHQSEIERMNRLHQSEIEQLEHDIEVLQAFVDRNTVEGEAEDSLP